MTLEQNKTLVREFIDAANRRDWQRFDTLVAVGVVRHSNGWGQPQVCSREQLREFLVREAETFPDAQETIRLLVAEDDKVAAHLTFGGTQLGPMGPFPASGKPLTLDFMAIFRLEKGRIAEVWVEWDNLSGLVQLGHLRLPFQP